LISLIFIIPGSSFSQSIGDNVISIDLQEAILKKQEIVLSRFVDKLEYIPLGITSESALSHIMYSPNVRVTDDYIIVSNYISGGNYQLLAFDRATGKFAHEIGRVGRGPEEYSRPLKNFYNRYDKKIYARGISNIKVYNQQGKFLESFVLPKVPWPSAVNGYSTLEIDAFLSEDVFSNFVNNETEVKNKSVFCSIRKVCQALTRTAAR